MKRVKIESLDHQGRGIARIDHKIVFLPNALPGEIVEIEITKEKKNFSEGKVLHYLEESKDRIPSACPYYPSCGGCQLLHIPYSKQLEYKEEKMQNILTRYQLGDIPLKKIVGSPKETCYRNKVTFQVQNGKLGYFEENSYHFIPISSCLLLDNKINDTIKSLPTKGEKIVVRSNEKEITYQKEKKILHTIGKYQFLVSLESFFQVNDSITPLLYEKVKEYLHPTLEDTVLDLYCGAGTIGIFVSDSVKKVIGIEKCEEAIRNAKENALLNHITNIEFFCGDAGIEASKLKERITSIIIDPPRSGLNKQTLDILLKISPKKIVYVSCDPMTFVRDLNLLKEDYRIEEITPFDMFPNTYHVENIAFLHKK